MVAGDDLGSKETAHSSPIDPVIEFHVFASVKLFIEHAYRREDFTPIGNRHTLWPDELLGRGIDERAGVVTETGCTARCDRPLQGRGLGDVERLRPAHAIRAAPYKCVG